MNWLKQFGMAIWTLIVAIGSIFLYEKYVDKPETVVNNKIGKVKNKGEGNNIETTSTTEVQQYNSQKKEKKKFRLIKRNK